METTLNKNYIGIPEVEAANLAKELNQLLADYHVFYQNLRAFHWNVRGNHFFTLHAQFEEMYDDAKVKIDELAERILTLGYVPIHNLKAILNESQIEEAETIGEASEIIKKLLNDFSLLLVQERKLLKLSDEIGDQGSNDLMSAYISEQEKVCWMLSAFLK